MKRAKVFRGARASVLALSLLVLPITTPLSAQTTTPAPNTARMETRDETYRDRDYTGLWGLLGLLGLAGLAGRRRPDAVQMYDNRTPPQTETHARR